MSTPPGPRLTCLTKLEPDHDGASVMEPARVVSSGTVSPPGDGHFTGESARSSSMVRCVPAERGLFAYFVGAPIFSKIQFCYIHF